MVDVRKCTPVGVGIQCLGRRGYLSASPASEKMTRNLNSWVTTDVPVSNCYPSTRLLSRILRLDIAQTYQSYSTSLLQPRLNIPISYIPGPKSAARHILNIHHGHHHHHHHHRNQTAPNPPRQTCRQRRLAVLPIIHLHLQPHHSKPL
ncbi:hypothetical protein PSPO01_03072 [Paraphaeosphaeria sporulosa]